MAPRVLVGSRRFEPVVNSACRPVVVVITSEGDRMAHIRFGRVCVTPVHAAACALCWDVIYDTPRFEHAVGWTRRHLADKHGVVEVEVNGGTRRRARMVADLVRAFWAECLVAA